MNYLSEEKRNQLMLVVLVVAVAITGLWFSLIRSQQEDLRTLAAEKAKDISKLSQIHDTIKNREKAKTELQDINARLALAEHDMPSGDLNVSLINTIRKFKDKYEVKISNFSPAGGDAPVNVFPTFPYRQITVNISGIAYYHDFGKFVADFENKFPTSRLLNLDLSPSSAANSDDKEKLSFQMDVVSLVAARPVTNP